MRHIAHSVYEIGMVASRLLAPGARIQGTSHLNVEAP